jgi:hypothetical protein
MNMIVGVRGYLGGRVSLARTTFPQRRKVEVVCAEGIEEHIRNMYFLLVFFPGDTFSTDHLYLSSMREGGTVLKVSPAQGNPWMSVYAFNT